MYKDLDSLFVGLISVKQRVCVCVCVCVSILCSHNSIVDGIVMLVLFVYSHETAAKQG